VKVLKANTGDPLQDTRMGKDISEQTLKEQKKHSKIKKWNDVKLTCFHKAKTQSEEKNANQFYNEISPHSSKNGSYQID
jgi:hypothetical protein